MEKRERKSYRTARTHALSILLGVCLLCTQLLNVHAANNPTATGESGTNGSGGGGGVVGGVAGEAILHSHVDGCYKSLAYNAGGSENCNGWGIDDMNLYMYNLNAGGNDTLNVGIYGSGWGDVHGYIAYVEVFNASTGAMIGKISSNGTHNGPTAWEGDDGWHGAPGGFDINKGVKFNIGNASRVTIHYYFGFTCSCHDNDNDNHSREWHPVHYQFRITSASFSGGKTKICAYNEGDVVRSKASFGGTSDASVTDTINKTVLNTTQKDITGDGTYAVGKLLNSTKERQVIKIENNPYHRSCKRTLCRTYHECRKGRYPTNGGPV